ncbi:MAG TPA: IPT/TIG domain-containing protein [Polyangiaceae bacterium]|nr:IPT/TIG domain-containing protein [Polyangiaceae bacterium]
MNWLRRRDQRSQLVFLTCFLIGLVSARAYAATPSRDFVYDANGRLSRAMDASGAVVTYTYDEVGNVTKISRDQVDPNFNILGVSPTTGGSGDNVTIQGAGFDSTLTNDTVTIDGVDATVESVDPSGRSMVIQVPWGAESGPLAVTVGGKTVTASDDFTVIHYGDVGIRGTLVGSATASYSVPLQAGQTVQIRLVDPNHTGFYPNVALLDPSEKQVASGSGADVGSIGYAAVTSGSFQIVVSDASSGKVGGDYILYYAVAPGSNEGGALDPNNPISGTIDEGDIDTFTFDGTAGQTVQLRVVDVAATAFIPELAVYDPTGKLVNYNDNYDVAAYGFSPSVSGKYTVMVWDASSGSASTGDYKIYYAVAPGSNEGGALDPNNPIDGVIDEGDIDTYTFTMTAGQTAQLRVVDVNATSFIPELVVYDPTGKLVNYNDNYDVAAYGFSAATSGTYTLMIFDASNGSASSGAYKVYYALAPGSNDGGTLDPNNPIDGVIDEGDIDSYTFDVTAGQTVQLRVTDVNATSFIPELVVYDPTGKLVNYNDNYDVAAYGFNAATSGRYTVMVFDASNGSSSSGAYKIYYALAPGSNDGGTLDPNNPIDGVIDEGDIDSYTFTVTAGETVQLRVTDVGATSFIPELAVYDPTGKLVNYNDNYDVAAYGFNAAVSGTYTVMVFDASSGSASTGAYKIYYAVAPGSNDGGALDPNEPIAGTIDEGDIDAYTFDVSAGTGVEVRVTDVGATSFIPEVVVYDPTGKLVGYNDNYDVAGYSFNAALSGTYTAMVFDASGGSASTGAYEIYYAEAPGSDGEGVLDPNNPVDGTLAEGAIDSYTFTVTAGSGVELRVVDTNQTSLYPYMIVYDPNGSVVSQAGGNDVAELAFAPAVSGTYTLTVFDNSNGATATGPYAVYYTIAPGSNEGGALDPTNPIAGTIDEGDLDSYTFNLTAGEGVQLRAADLGATGFYPYYVVYDPTGKVVGQVGGNDVAALSFSAAVSGTYTLVLFDASNGYASTGAYNLYYTLAPGSNEGGALTIGTPVDGTIDLGDLDSYTFSATAGEKLQLVATDLNSTAFTPYIAVYGPTGTSVVNASGATTATASFTATTAGTYTFVVFDASNGYASTGDYSLLLTQN